MRAGVYYYNNCTLSTGSTLVLGYWLTPEYAVISDLGVALVNS